MLWAQIVLVILEVLFYMLAMGGAFSTAERESAKDGVWLALSANATFIVMNLLFAYAGAYSHLLGWPHIVG
jgi:hypothetical protein